MKEHVNINALDTYQHERKNARTVSNFFFFFFVGGGVGFGMVFEVEELFLLLKGMQSVIVRVSGFVK